jgi:hypothetical protein
VAVFGQGVQRGVEASERAAEWLCRTAGTTWVSAAQSKREWLHQQICRASISYIEPSELTLGEAGGTIIRRCRCHTTIPIDEGFPQI